MLQLLIAIVTTLIHILELTILNLSSNQLIQQFFIIFSLKTVETHSEFSQLMRLNLISEIEQIIISGVISILANAIDEVALNGSDSST